jgi:protocatechuate 3,4-dioxygenase beta subunit
MKKEQESRRSFIYLLVGGGLLAAGGYPFISALSQSGERKGKQQQRLAPTHSNSLGPFYKKGAPRKEKLSEADEAGTPLVVAGRVINTDGEPLTNAVIEVFHADNSGNYDMQGYRLRGQVLPHSSGDYQFETIVPGGYGGRPQHIHYVVTAPGHRQLVTQLYFANDPFFGGNPEKNYSRDSLVDRELIRPVNLAGQGRNLRASVAFDICLEKS